MIQMNLTPQILTANIVFYNLEPITLCIQENCVTKKNVEGINRNKSQIHQSQPTTDIATKVTGFLEQFCIDSAVPLAIVLLLVFLSCS